MAKHYIIPIFVPHWGCPHDCVFCNQKRITGMGAKVEPQQAEVKETIKVYLGTIAKSKDKGTVEVAFYGGSFTAIPIEKQLELLKPAYAALKRKQIDQIRISTRPDCINVEILSFLKSNGVSIIELGVQSMDSEVLMLAGRGHTAVDVYRAVEIIRETGAFSLGLQMMVGLPGDTRAKAEQTAQEIIKLKPDFVRIYPTLVIKDTPLEKLYLKEQYIALSVEEAVEITKEVYLAFINKDIPVIRIGLQPSNEINEEGDVVAGPFHPAFRELVESSLALDKLTQLLKQAKINMAETLTVLVSPKDISIVRGQRNKNIEYLKTVYGFKNIAVLPDEKLKRRELELKFD